MNQRKSAILDQARRLFNDSGTYAISTRDIAKAMGISQGNLTYHFPHRASIIEALYTEMNHRLDEIRHQVQTTEPGLESLFHWTIAQQRLQEEYRFIWLDMARLRRDHPAINQHFSALIEAQRQQFPMLIHDLAEAGILQRGIESDAVELLFEQILILGNFWQHAEEVLQDLQSHKVNYATITLGPFLPYLTSVGKAEWKNLTQSSGHGS